MPDGTFRIHVDGSVRDTLEARAVVVAARILREPRIPRLAAGLPRDVLSIHTAHHLHPGLLPPGAILVVGSAQSGGQVSEDLVDAGRTVHLSTSRVVRFRRRTRGRDTFEWAAAAGFFDQTVEDLSDPALRFAPQPIISGVGRYGHTLSVQSLVAKGLRLLGHLRAAEGGLPPLEDDPADDPYPEPEVLNSPPSIDLVSEGISTVIWSTGSECRFDWLPASAVDERGAPSHDGPATPIPGLFVLGSPWLTRRGSGIVYGVDDDARLVADLVADRLTA